MRFYTPSWPAPHHVVALQTCRQGGFSLPPYNSLNLATHVKDARETVMRNRALLPLPKSVGWLNQTHSDICIELPCKDLAKPADASYTYLAEQVCVVLTADCLPVLLTNKSGDFVAAVHCGWRGLANGLLANTLTAINCNRQDLLVWLGPAIGPSAFEVGDDVYQFFMQQDPLYNKAFKSQSIEGKFLANIYDLAKIQLRQLGAHNIYSDELCTYTQSSQYFSFRRDGQTGRQASFIWMKNSY
ncbi:peptidoglycan editing factor PgeF [Catenovulum sediminis]|uniref:Purine nucleoside phosphorylase n=1 Tax=Catenovulum sediminis TaxID=1740262 RepID=A0ABV1RNH7_9ALTE|nr:peptidoglycan editing factor PgeF [Catenovulum sediminis]